MNGSTPKRDWIHAPIALQKEIAGAFLSTGAAWLLTAGCSDRRISLAPSLDAQLAQALLQNAPLTTGCQNLSGAVQESVWRKTNQAFAKAIQAHDGSVENCIQARRPDVHLAGRVYFHLVENKEGKLPFAFMATYFTRLSQIEGIEKDVWENIKKTCQGNFDSLPELMEGRSPTSRWGRCSPRRAWDCRAQGDPAFLLLSGLGLHVQTRRRHSVWHRRQAG